MVNTVTKAALPATCRSRRCPACLAMEALKIADAIAMSAPTRGLLVTAPGGCWSDIQRSMNRLREYLSREGCAGQWCYHAEYYPDGDGAAHVHAWRYGPPVSTAALKRAASKADVGFVTDHAIRSLSGASRYGMKEVINSVSPGAVSLSEAQVAYLEINGNHLVHPSRGFWRDRNGQGVQGGVREAVRIARGTQGRESDWKLMPAVMAVKFGIRLPDTP